MKKILSPLLIAGLIITNLSGPLALAQTTDFSDLPNSDPNYLAIQWGAATGLLEGYDNGDGTRSFQPEKTVNRAEMLKIVVAGQGYDPDANTYKNCFEDVNEEWFARYVCFAKEQGWVSGTGVSEGTRFEPASTVNNAEAAKILVNSQGWSDEVPASVTEEIYENLDNSQWYAPYFYVLHQYGVLEEDGPYLEAAAEKDRGAITENLFRIQAVIQTDSVIYDKEARDEILTEAGLAEIIPSTELIVVSDYSENGDEITVENGGYSIDEDGVFSIESYGEGAYLQVTTSYEMTEEGTISIASDELETDSDGIVTVNEYANEGDDYVVTILSYGESNTGGGSTSTDERDLSFEIDPDDKAACIENLTEALGSNPFANYDDSDITCNMQGYAGYVKSTQTVTGYYDLTSSEKNSSYTYTQNSFYDFNEEEITTLSFGMLRLNAYIHDHVAEYDLLTMVILEGQGTYSYDWVDQKEYINDYEDDSKDSTTTYNTTVSGPNGSVEVWEENWEGWESWMGNIAEDGTFTLSVGFLDKADEFYVSDLYFYYSTMERSDGENSEDLLEEEKTYELQTNFYLTESAGLVWDENGFDYTEDNSSTVDYTVLGQEVQTILTDIVEWHVEPIE